MLLPILKKSQIALYTLLGLDMPIDSQDRRILEKIIIPNFVSQNEFNKILFVGCGSYTKHYNNFFKKKEYWTIDINPLKKIYGSKNHIVDSMRNLNLYFSDNYLDLIICNGVFGRGMNDREEVEEAFGNSFNCLRDGGILIIGWNDVPGSKPFPLETCQSLNQFKPYWFSPLSGSQYSIDESDNHTFNFYIKK
jgi:SAM-dependent methyltransferase